MSRQHTVLVIDDEPDVVKSVQNLLRLECRVLGATGAADGLGVLQREPVDVVITDQRMPGMSGIELLHRIRGEYPDTIRIILTAYADIRTILDAINEGNVFRYLVKPWDPEELRGVVRQAFERHELIADRKKLLQDLTTKVDDLKTANANLAAVQAELQSLNQTLEHRVVLRTAEAERRASQLRSLAGQLTGAESQERRRIAQVLHEELQQLLVAARLALRRLRAASGTKDRLHAGEQADDLLRRAIESSQSLTAELRPPILYELGLVPALEWLAGRMLERHSLSVRVEADALRTALDEPVLGFVFEAVRELLFNVTKHARVREAQVRISCSGEDWLRIAVIDQGVGFDPAGAVGHGSPSGFGLFSIRERLQLLGGNLEIDSVPGQGARVVLAVPQGAGVHQGWPGGAVTHRAVLPGLEAVVDNDRKIRVLLADDHKIVREGLADLLEHEGDIEVVGEADDGVNAIELARKLLPDVVVMDVTMPRMNGIEATVRIVSEMPAVRVVGLSMHHEMELATAMVDAGATAYLSKSGPMDALLAAIRECWPQKHDSVLSVKDRV